MMRKKRMEGEREIKRKGRGREGHDEGAEEVRRAARKLKGRERKNNGQEGKGRKRKKRQTQPQMRTVVRRNYKRNIRKLYCKLSGRKLKKMSKEYEKAEIKELE